MIRYAATTSTCLRVARARSLAAVTGGNNRSKSTPARQEAFEEEDPVQAPPRFKSRQKKLSWRDRLEHHHQQSSSTWRDGGAAKDEGLSDFFSRRRRNNGPARPQTPAFARRPSSPPVFVSRPPSDRQTTDRPSNELPSWRRQPRTESSSFQTPERSSPRRSNRRMPNQNQQQQQQQQQLQPKSYPSFCGRAQETGVEESSSKDMADVSELRAAFLKSVKSHFSNDPKTKPATTTPAPIKKSAWRSGSAKQFRQQKEQQRREQQEKKAQAWRARQSVKTFYLPQEEKAKLQQEQEAVLQHQQEQAVVDKRVMLPKDGGDVDLLSSVLRVSKKRVIQILTDLGEVDASLPNFKMDVDTMELVTLELGMEPVRDTRRGARHVEDDKSLLLQRRAAATQEEEAAASYESLSPRPPVVACMGHVDHGKTTLMDALRRKSRAATAPSKKSKKKKAKKGAAAQEKGDVAGTEAGGITQVISAFQIALDSERGAVTFLDTPGHAAFSSMRESGSHAADVIVLVIAADDGVSPQTVEILDFYKSILDEAGSGAISLVVAMTKIDKPGINVDESRMRIENQLLEHGIMTEDMASTSTSEEHEFGPPVQLIPVSGLTGDGLDDLIEGLELQSEVMDLRADEAATAEGIVMDARIEKGLGVVADCIVRWGSLERGNVVVSGVHSGKVKVLKDVNGKTLKKGMPSQPVRIIGFESLPKAGDPVICVSSEEKAKRLVEKREERLDSDPTATFRKDSVDEPHFQAMGTASKTASMQQMAEDKYEIDDETDENTIRIPVIIKADADGTLAAVRDSLLEVGTMSSTYNLIVDPVGMGIGPILTSDVALAQQSGAAIFAFGLDKLNDKTTINMAEGEGVTIRNHDVIYSLLDDAKDVFAQHLPPAPVEVVHGSATVQAVFDINNKRNAERIAGLKVMDGTLYKNKADKLDCHYRVLRDGERISPDGETVRASSLRRVKEDVENVRHGDECGLGLDGFRDVQEGDTIECYSIEMKRVFV